MNLQHGGKIVSFFLLIQLGVALVLCFLATCFAGKMGMLSAILGAFVYIVPNLFFMRKVFRHQGAIAAKKIVYSFYQGEALKIVFSLVLFAAVFALFNVEPWIFFGSYIGMQLLILIAQLIFI